jgi:HEAT repeat protein
LGIRAEAAVPVLAKALEDEDRRVRRLSAEALARIGPPAKSAAPALIKALNDADERARQSFAELLRQAPRSSRLIFPAPVRKIPVSNEHVRVRSMAVAALERIGSGAVPALTEALKSADPDARVNVAEVLGRLGEDGKSAVPVLASLLRTDKDARVRETAAHAFSNLYHYDPVLVEALKDEEPRIRLTAVTAIHNSGGLDQWEAVVAVIEVLAKDKDASVRAEGYYVLDHRADASIPTLISGLEQKNAPRRARAVELLGQLADEAVKRTEEGRLATAFLEAALPALTKAIKDDDIRVRDAAVEAVKKIEALKKMHIEKR